MQTKQVYQLDEKGTFIGVTEAQESPLEPGVFMIPGDCIDTDVAPPVVDELTQFVFWQKDSWYVGTYDADPSIPTPEQKARAWRDAELQRADIQLLKVQDGMPNLGSVNDWRKYRVALRTWPEVEGFPSATSAPQAPDRK